jgi:YHS domain-containing protein
MLRVAIEAITTITLLLVARAIISSILASFTKKASGSKPGAKKPDDYRPEEHAPTRGTLHRDPVCGTFVPETTQFRREVTGRQFYYCSQDCRDSHFVVSPNLNHQDTASRKARRANP